MKFIFRRLFLIFVAIFFATTLNAKEGKVIGSSNHEVPSWFKDSFLDISEDIEEATEKNKHFMIFLDFEGCPYCSKMLKESFEEELKKDISKEVFERQKEIEKSKVEQKIDIKQSKEIEDEIIEEKSQIEKPITKQKKDLITKKDNYKYDLKTKPKLVIIIDDVVSKTQKDKILNIGYPITMAFLPPKSGHKESAIIAQNLPFHMIHLPMQASKNFKNIEVNTLNISDSYETIEARVKQLRVLYPNATYTNNHTGSVFTENYEAMDKLFRALKKYNFIFVDSRTTPNSVAKELSIKYQMPYIVRDTFLDNDRSFTAIQNQLKDAIRVAKKQGFAIAIGHPYEVTFQVLKESKHLLNDVEPIFLNKLPYL